MKKNDFTVKIGGEAGQGINAAALILAKAFSRGGLNAFILSENPNTIKGLHNWCSIRVSGSNLTSQTDKVDILIALNDETIPLHTAELNPGGIVIYDGETLKADAAGLSSTGLVPVFIPLEKMVKELGVEKIMRNSITLGAVFALVKYDFHFIENIFKELFARKGSEVIAMNLKVARAGYDFINENFKTESGLVAEKTGMPVKMLLNGNEAMCMGALKAGCKWLSAYPMTPASPMIHYMAPKEKEYGIIVKQTEDEIAAINMAIGANYAGVRGFCCTSGGGFSLMVEALGMAGQNETPLVVAMGQRPGPSTGQPTHTSQGDLKFIVNAGQGEFPRIVVAPGDINECFFEMFNAFNLAEKYQVPVIVLYDKYIGESYVSTPVFDTAGLRVSRGKLLSQEDLARSGEYKRYAVTEDGISPRVIPSMKSGEHVATSYEHNECGFYEESPEGVVKMADKRSRKYASIQNDGGINWCKTIGDADADITVVTWGSNKGPILEALQMLKNDGIKANLLQILYVWPFSAELVSGYLKKAKNTIIVEANKTGQLKSLIREQTGITIANEYFKYDGQPFYPSVVYHRIKEVLG
jgi:2-oxoglutarate ferredoxin oxidoreductase subunit alpha